MIYNIYIIIYHIQYIYIHSDKFDLYHTFNPDVDRWDTTNLAGCFRIVEVYFDLFWGFLSEMRWECPPDPTVFFKLTYHRLLAYECLWMFMLADKNTVDVPSYLGWSNFDRYGPWELSRWARRKGVESSIILQLPPSLRRFTGGFGRLQDAVLPSKLVTGRKSCFFRLSEAVWSIL